MKQAVSTGLGVGGAFALRALIRGTIAALANHEIPWVAVIASAALSFALFGGSTFILFGTGALRRTPADGTLQASPWLVAAVCGGVVAFLAGVLLNMRLAGAAFDRGVLWEEIWVAIVAITWLASRALRRGDT